MRGPRRWVFLLAVFLAACDMPMVSQLTSPKDPANGGKANLPSAPSGLSVSAGDGQVTLEWSPVSGATSYNLYWSAVQSAAPTARTRIGSVSSPFTLTGLANGTTYYYAVTAVNGGGESAASLQQSATPQVSATGAPTGLTATASSGQASLTWNSVSGATGYNVYRSGSSGSQGTKLNSTLISSTNYTDTGLTNGTAYYYEVTAVNAGGESAASIQQSATPQVSAAGAPTGLAATASTGQVSLTWNTTSGATGYNVYRSGSSGSQGTKLNSTLISSANYTDTGLTNGTAYYYEVTAVNAGGESAASIQQSATPQIPAPGQPTGLTATAGVGQVSLAWIQVSAATGYNLYRSGSSGSRGTKLNSTLISTTGYTDPGLTNGITYYYEVTAVNAGGESAASSQVPSTPQVYTVTYNDGDSSGGVAPVDSNAYGPSSVATVFGSGTLFKSGFTLAGWMTGSDGLGTSYAFGATFGFSANVTLYPVWVPAGLNYQASGTTISITGYNSLPTGALTIPPGVTDIASSALANCASLTAVGIPGSVKTVGAQAFQNCPGLSAIAVDPSNPNYTSLSGVLYNKPMTILIEAPGALAGGFIVPSSVMTVNAYAFCYCQQLTSMAISSNSACWIGASAFSFCLALQAVTMVCNGAAVFIDTGAFSLCPALQSVTLQSNTIQINGLAFSPCSALTNVTLQSSTLATGVDATTFQNDPAGLLFHVPSNLVSAYKAAPSWQPYASQIVSF